MANVDYKKELEILAVKDSLTNIGNRRFFHKKLDEQILLTQRYNHPFSLVIFDIDFFKKVNDNYGHDMGDKVLVEYTKFISSMLRDTDIFCRIGGEEFIVILPNTEKNQAIEAAERMLGFVLSDSCIYDGEDIAFSLSAGVVSVIYEDTVCDLMDRANRSLSLAKASGGRCISGELASVSKQVRYLK